MRRHSSTKIRSIHGEGFRTRTRPFTAPIFAGIDLDESSIELLKKQDLDFIQYVFKNSPTQKTSLLGTVFPKSIKKLILNSSVSCNEDLETEIKWKSALFIAFADRLNSWLTAKKQFEISFLTGDLTAASEAISTARTKHGYSLWDLECQLLLATKLNGLEGNREQIHKINSKSPNWIKLFLPFFGHRAEPDFSVSEYHSQLDSLLTPESDASKDLLAIFDVVRFRLSPTEHNPDRSFSSILNFEESHSLLDRFLIWIRVIERLYASSLTDIPGKAPVFINSVIHKVKSPRLTFLNHLLHPKQTVSDKFTFEIFQILDAYTSGQYAESFQRSLAILSENPTILEPYELVAKSAIQLSTSPISPYESDSISTHILRAMMNVLSRGSETACGLDTILSLSYQLDSFSIGPQLRCFHNTYSRDISPLCLDTEIGITSSSVTPRTYASLCDPKEALSHLKQLSEVYPNNASVKLFLTGEQSIMQQSLEHMPNNIPDERVIRYNGFILERLGQHKEALATYKKVQERIGLCASELSGITAGLYRCYSELNDISKAARLLVESVISSTHIVAEETLKDLLSKYPKDGDSDISSDIAWPILFSIAQIESYCPHNYRLLHDILDDFLSSRDLQKPSELLDNISIFNLSELVYLLRNVCIPEVLLESIWYDNQEALMQERLQLCDWLAEVDPANQTDYQNEITELSRVAAIRELTHKAERSRIYVDTNRIFEQLPKSIISQAERCLALGSLREEYHRNTIQLLGFLEQLEVDNVVLIDEGFKLFLSVFNEIKSQFVSSNQYGLDANLSQRIRHGTLAGALRASFENNHLVTHKGLDGFYSQNVFWHERLTFDSTSTEQQIHKTLSVFSESVDSMISEVRNEWVQINDYSSHQSALFIFDFENSELQEMYRDSVECENASEFIDMIFSALWKRTEDSLRQVRRAMQEDLKIRFFSVINQCETSIETTIGKKESASIRTTFTTCRTQLTRCLEEISDWFRLDEQQRIPDYPIRTVIEAVLVIVKRSSAQKKIRYNLKIENEILIPGDVFRSMWDILFILFDNANKHSGLETTGISIKISSKKNTLILSVENELAESIDRLNLTKKIDDLNSLTGKEDDLAASRTEGGSGYSKLHKIISYDMRVEDHEVKVLINNNLYCVTITMDVPWD